MKTDRILHFAAIAATALLACGCAALKNAKRPISIEEKIATATDAISPADASSELRMANERAVLWDIRNKMTVNGCYTRWNDAAFAFSLEDLEYVDSRCDSLDIVLGLDAAAKRITAERFRDSCMDRPLTVAILPPVNNSTKVEAKEAFYLTPGYELCQCGYYICPPMMMFDILKNEGVYDTEQLTERHYATFNGHFGVDAVLRTTILDWKKAFVNNSVDVVINYKLISTRTGSVLWNKTATVSAKVKSNSLSLNPLAMLIDAGLTRLNTVLSFKESNLAWECNSLSLSLPSSIYTWKIYDPYMNWTKFSAEEVKVEKSIEE